MHGTSRFNIVWNAIIDWISVSAETALKNIWLADKVYNFGWNSPEPQKIWWRRGACYKISAWWWRKGLTDCGGDYLKILQVILPNMWHHGCIIPQTDRISSCLSVQSRWQP